MSRRVFNTLELQDIVNMYETGISVPKIANKYNVSNTKIYYVLKKNNTIIRNMSESHQKYKLNENYFDTIDNPEKAYVLGFIAADGTLSLKKGSIRIRLAKQDEHILYDIKEKLGYNGPLYYYNSNKIKLNNIIYNCQDAVELSIYNKHIVNILFKIGIVPNKTEYLNPIIINEKFFYNFLLGYFDGDGCVIWTDSTKKANVTICGTVCFLENIRKELLKFKISSHIYKRHKHSKSNGGYQLTISGNQQIKKFLQLMYNNLPTIYLRRKYDKYKYVINKINELKPYTFKNKEYWSNFKKTC